MASGGIMPTARFSGHEGTVSIREYIEDFQWLVTANAWTPERAAAYLAVHLEGDAKEFVRQLARTDPLSIQTFDGLREALIQRYEGNSAVLRNRREWDARRRLPGESINTYASGLRGCFDRAFPAPPKPEELKHDADVGAQRKQAEAAAIYKFFMAHRESVLLSKFINGLSTSQREALICDESVLQASLDEVIRRLARLEAELAPSQVQAVSTDSTATENSPTSEGTTDATVQGVSERTQPLNSRRRRGAVNSDICRNCQGRGHWAKDCSSPRLQGNGKGLANRAKC